MVSTTTTIPLLPCTAGTPTLEFYGALGFDVTHHQTHPYLYLALARGELTLHFKDAAPQVDPADELTGGCLVLVDEVGSSHRDFADGLLTRYGHVPVRGVPRLTRLRPGGSRFSIFDPSGNCLVFVERGEPDVEYGGAGSLSGLAKALDNVRIYRDFKHDDVLAARALDTALRRHRDTAAPREVARALADRIELAIALNDDRGADAAETELRDLRLGADDLQSIAVELAAVEQLRRWLA